MEYKMIYRAKDGTTFDTKAEVEAYVKLLETPHIKKLIDRVEKLEQEIATMRVEIATLHREPAKPSWPVGQPIMYDQYHKPQAEFNYETYNPTTGVKNG